FDGRDCYSGMYLYIPMRYHIIRMHEKYTFDVVNCLVEFNKVYTSLITLQLCNNIMKSSSNPPKLAAMLHKLSGESFSFFWERGDERAKHNKRFIKVRRLEIKIKVFTHRKSQC